MYLTLEETLTKMAVHQSRANPLRKKLEPDAAAPHIFVSNPNRVLLLCSLFLLRPQLGRRPFTFNAALTDEPLKELSLKSEVDDIIANAKILEAKYSAETFDQFGAVSSNTAARAVVQSEMTEAEAAAAIQKQWRIRTDRRRSAVKRHVTQGYVQGYVPTNTEASLQEISEGSEVAEEAEDAKPEEIMPEARPEPEDKDKEMVEDPEEAIGERSGEVISENGNQDKVEEDKELHVEAEDIPEQAQAEAKEEGEAERKTPKELELDVVRKVGDHVVEVLEEEVARALDGRASADLLEQPKKEAIPGETSSAVFEKTGEKVEEEGGVELEAQGTEEAAAYEDVPVTVAQDTLPIDASQDAPLEEASQNVPVPGLEVPPEEAAPHEPERVQGEDGEEDVEVATEHVETEGNAEVEVTSPAHDTWQTLQTNPDLKGPEAEESEGLPEALTEGFSFDGRQAPRLPTFSFADEKLVDMSLAQMSVSGSEGDGFLEGMKASIEISKELLDPAMGEVVADQELAAHAQETMAEVTALMVENEADESSQPNFANPVVDAILTFRPTPRQLALRVRELVAADELKPEEQAKSIENLLSRWGEQSTGLSLACLAAISRDPSSLRGQSSLDVSIHHSNYMVTHTLLRHVPLAAQEVQGHEEVAKLLNGHNPVTGQTLLYAAILYPNRHSEKIVEELVKRSADINWPGSSMGPEAEAPLVNCIRRAERPLISCMLRLKADMNSKSSDGSSLAQVAVLRGHPEILQAVLQAPNVEVDKTDSELRTAVHTAVVRGRHAAPLVRMLLQAAANAAKKDLDGLEPVVFAAASMRDQETCELLLACRANPNAECKQGQEGRVIHLATKAKNKSMLLALLAARADPNVKEADARSVLHLAVGLNMPPSCLQALLEAKADPGARAGPLAGGETPLRLVALQELGKTKSSWGMLPKPPPGKRSSRPSLTMSAPEVSSEAPLEAAELLLKARADPNDSNLAGCSALHAACAAGQLQLVELLVTFRADPSRTDKRRWNALHFAASSGHAAMVHFLLSLDVDSNVTNHHGQTALHLAELEGNAAVEILSHRMELKPVKAATFHGSMLKALSEQRRSRRWNFRSAKQSTSLRSTFSEGRSSFSEIKPEKPQDVRPPSAGPRGSPRGSSPIRSQTPRDHFVSGPKSPPAMTPPPSMNLPPVIMKAGAGTPRLLLSPEHG